MGEHPGALTVRLNGVQIFTGQWWDYSDSGQGWSGEEDLSRLGPKRAPGQRVTMTVTPGADDRRLGRRPRTVTPLR